MLLCLSNEVESDIRAEGGRASELAARFAEQAAKEGVPLGGHHQIVRRVRVVERQNVIPIKDRAGKPYKGYIRGGNEFADVWRMRDGSWKIAIIPTFDANQPGFDLENFRPVDKFGRKDPTAKRLMRLQINDMGAVGEGASRHIIRVRSLWNEIGRPRVALDGDNEANAKERGYSARQLQRQGFRKVGVDEIGRVLDPGPTS